MANGLVLGIQNHLTGVMFVVRRERIFVKVAWAGIQLNSEMTNWLDQYDQYAARIRWRREINILT